MKTFALLAIAMLACAGFMPTTAAQASMYVAGGLTAFCVCMAWFAQKMGL